MEKTVIQHFEGTVKICLTIPTVSKCFFFFPVLDNLAYSQHVLGQVVTHVPPQPIIKN